MLNPGLGVAGGEQITCIQYVKCICNVGVRELCSYSRDIPYVLSDDSDGLSSAE
jgi:hypothetical protein